MPLLPMSPPMGGGLAMPPPGAGAPQGLMPPPPDLPPAGMGAMALAPLAAQQQQALDAFKQQQAMEAIQTALAAMASQPNPLAEAAVTEPGPTMDPGVSGQGDPMATNGGY